MVHHQKNRIEEKGGDSGSIERAVPKFESGSIAPRKATWSSEEDLDSQRLWNVAELEEAAARVLVCGSRLALCAANRQRHVWRGTDFRRRQA